MVSNVDREFLIDFFKSDRYFDLDGCKTARSIEIRVRRGVQLMQLDLQNTTDEIRRRNLLKAIKVISIVFDNSSPVIVKTARIKRKMGVPVKRCGMHYRIIDEAKKYPDGFFANCLRWGIDVAEIMEKDEILRGVFDKKYYS